MRPAQSIADDLRCTASAVRGDRALRLLLTEAAQAVELYEQQAAALILLARALDAEVRARGEPTVAMLPQVRASLDAWSLTKAATQAISAALAEGEPR